MGFDLYPAGTPPLRLAAGATGSLVPFTERSAEVGPGQRVMVVAVAESGPACEPPGGPAPAPAVLLQADTGPATRLPLAPDTISIRNAPGQAAPRVATANLRRGDDGVTLVRVSVRAPVGTWQLQLENTDPARARLYVWVVADADAEARRPWVNVPDGLAFEADAGEAVTEAAQVANHGTGPLEVTTPDGAQLANRFHLVDVVPRTVPPGRCATVRVRFQAPTSDVDIETVGHLATNDPAAGAAGHDARLALTAEVRRGLIAPGDIVVLAGAASTLASLHVDTVDRVTGARTTVASGGHIVDPSCLAVEPEGSVLVADGGHNVGGVASLVRLDRATAAQSVVSSGRLLRAPLALAVGRDGPAYVLDRAADGVHRVIRVDRRTGDQSIVTAGAHLIQPLALAVEPTGTILVTNAQTQAGPSMLLRVDPATSEQEVFVAAGLLAAHNGGGAKSLAIEADGSIVVGRTTGHTASGATTPGALVRVSPAGTPRTIVDTGIGVPRAVGVEADGTILVANFEALLRVDPRTGVVTRFVGGGSAALTVVPPVPEA